MISLNLYHTPARWVLSTLFRQGHQGRETLNNALKVTQLELVNIRAGIQTYIFCGPDLLPITSILYFAQKTITTDQEL